MTRQTTRFDETQPVVGGVGNDTGIGLSRSMFALSLYSRATQQLRSTGENGLCKRLYILELFNCFLRWTGTDQVSVLTASNFVIPKTSAHVLAAFALSRARA